MSKNTFSKKRCHFWFWAISAETTIFTVFPGLHCFGSKKCFGQNRSCARKCAFFPLPDTNSVKQFLQKIILFDFFIFLDDHLKNTIFIGCVAFSIFFFSFSVFSNIQRKNNVIFFSKTSFLTSPKFCKKKHYFGTMWHYLCFQKSPKTL